MWRLYAGQRKGVAIRTTVDRLGAALTPFRLAPHYGEEMPFWGNVRYVDLLQERLHANMAARFFYKHRAFAWEREFRVAISLRGAEEYGVQVPDEGIRVDFDSNVLIQEIHIGPSLSPEERSGVLMQCEEIGAPVRPIVSTLLGKPRYV